MSKISHFGLFNPNRQNKLAKLYHFLQSFGQQNYYQKINIRSITKFKPDLIHFHFAPLGVLLKWIPESMKIPYTFSVRGSEILILSKLDKTFQQEFKRFAIGASGIHCVSKHLALEMSDLIGSHPNMQVINTPAVQGVLRPYSRKDKVKLIAVGRLHWVKNFSAIILACSMLRKAGVNFQLNIIGEGEKRAELQYMIKDLDLGDSVKLSGGMDHDKLIEELKGSDFLVMSSHSEGFPNVFIEAVFNSIPVISSPLPGLKDNFISGIDFIESDSNKAIDIFKTILKTLKMTDIEMSSVIKSAFDKASQHYDTESHQIAFKKFYTRALQFKKIYQT